MKKMLGGLVLAASSLLAAPIVAGCRKGLDLVLTVGEATREGHRSLVPE